MTAAIQDIATTDKLGTPEVPEPTLLSFPVETNTQIFAGTMVATNAAGNAVPASASSALKLWGRAERGVNNLNTNAPFGAAGAQQVSVMTGVFYFSQDASIAQANIGASCFAVDDNTVSLNDGGGTRPFAGIIYPQQRFLTKSLTTADSVPVFVGQANAYGVAASGVLNYKARAVVTANITTLGGAGTFAGVAGGSTTNSDGVTCVAGDIVLLTAQTTATQNGPYVVGTVAAGTAPLTRPNWFVTGSTQTAALAIKVGGEGTVYKNTTWQPFISASSFVVDTTDGKFYPLSVTFTAALVAGNLVAGVGATAGAPTTMAVFSANSSVVGIRKTANTSTATTGGYQPIVNATPGPPGTGAAVLQAAVAAGTINAADISTMIVTVTNQI